MSSKVWDIWIQKHTKMIQHHVYIRSIDQFNQVGVHEKKNDRYEINSLNDHRVWLCIRVTFFSSHFTHVVCLTIYDIDYRFWISLLVL